MLAGIITGFTWAMETTVIVIAWAMTPFVSTEQAIFWHHLFQHLYMTFFSYKGMCIQWSKR